MIVITTWDKLPVVIWGKANEILISPPRTSPACQKMPLSLSMPPVSCRTYEAVKSNSRLHVALFRDQAVGILRPRCSKVHQNRTATPGAAKTKLLTPWFGSPARRVEREKGRPRSFRGAPGLGQVATFSRKREAKR